MSGPAPSNLLNRLVIAIREENASHQQILELQMPLMWASVR